MPAHKKRKIDDSAASARPEAARAEIHGLAPARVGFNHLPLEVLYRIFIEARSQQLPLVNRLFWHTLVHAPDTVRFAYLAGLWEQYQIDYLASHKCEPGHRRSDRKTTALQDFEVDVAAQRKKTPGKVKIRPVLPQITCCHRVSTKSTHVYDFVLRFAVCTPAVLHLFKKKVDSFVKAGMPSSWQTCPSLPKRLFTSLRTPTFDRQPSQPDAAEQQEQPKLSYKTSVVSSRDFCNFTSTSHGLFKKFELQQPGLSEQERIGPLPSPAEVDLLFSLLFVYKSPPDSYEGYALVKAVQHRAYALIKILLRFGADRNIRSGRPIEVAIRNIDLFALRLLTAMPYELTRPADKVSKPKWVPQPDRSARLNQRHLQLAIKENCLRMFTYLWYTGLVVPDMESLRLMEQYRRFATQTALKHVETTKSADNNASARRADEARATDSDGQDLSAEIERTQRVYQLANAHRPILMLSDDDDSDSDFCEESAESDDDESHRGFQTIQSLGASTPKGSNQAIARVRTTSLVDDQSDGDASGVDSVL